MAEKRNADNKTVNTINKQNYPTVSVKINRMIEKENTKLKAVASVFIDRVFAVHEIKVMDSQKGLFVQMPQNSYQKDGKMVYEDIFHPLTADSRKELCDAVLQAYEQQLDMSDAESYGRREQDENAAEKTEKTEIATDGDFTLSM